MNLFKFSNRKATTFCKRRFVLCVILFALFCISYIEVISYMLNARSWFQLQCTDASQCLKILLVADPQITGHEHVEPLKVIAQYDGDSYLKKTYEHALNFVEPNLTIFLGDLMDEGSTATESEYQEYLERFFNIFPKSNKIWLPGDNDVGGEGRDRVTVSKLKRFAKHFHQDNTVKLGRYYFLSVNQMTRVLPKFSSNRNFYNTTEIYIILSHLPLLFMPSRFVEKVLSKIQPQVVFSAHQHKAMILSSDGTLRQDRQIIPLNPGDNKPYSFLLGSDDLYEVMVPTCSYRMGTKKIGFGYAVLDNDVLHYTVLWSPSRFHQLWNLVLIVLIVIVIVILIKFY